MSYSKLLTRCRSTMLAKLVCITSGTCSCMLVGCATVTVPQPNGAPPAVVKCFGCKVSVPAGNGSITIDQSETAVAAGQSVLTKALEVGGTALANRAIDKAAEAQAGVPAESAVVNLD